MSDLEEAILQSQDNQIKREMANSEYIFTDELGITITKTVREMCDTTLGFYLAYRVYKKSKDVYVDPDDGGIHQGHNPMPLQEDKQTLLKLAAASYTRPGATVYAWEYLHEMLPKLDRSKLVIMPGLLFDRETGALIKTDGKELTI